MKISAALPLEAIHPASRSRI